MRNSGRLDGNLDDPRFMMANSASSLIFVADICRHGGARYQAECANCDDGGGCFQETRHAGQIREIEQEVSSTKVGIPIYQR